MKFEKNFAIAYFRDRKPLWRMLDTIAITTLSLVISFFLQPDDPFSLLRPIPWIAFAPLLCSLLYATLNGLISLIILVVTLIFYNNYYHFDPFLIREYMGGLACLTLLAGLFSSYWTARVSHVEHLNRYVREHLENLSRNYYLLRVSHERIEHSYIIKPLSFRDAFAQIKQKIALSDGEFTKETGDYLLQIFAQYCSMNSAIFYLYNKDKKQLKKLATLGKPFKLKEKDPLIVNTFKKRMSSYIAVNESDAEKSDYVACVPLLDYERQIIGLIVIKDMPFWALTHDNLEVLSVFSDIYALCLSRFKLIEDLTPLFPEAPPEFLYELQTLVRLRADHYVDSALSAITLPNNALQQNILYSLHQYKRTLDYLWILKQEDCIVVIILLPLTNQEGVQGFKKRLTNWLKSDFGQTLNKDKLYFRYQLLNQYPAHEQLSNFIKEATYATV